VEYIQEFAKGIRIATSSSNCLAFRLFAFGIVVLCQQFDGFSELFVSGIELSVRHLEFIVFVGQDGELSL
jgi:hypothetical protein